MNGLELCARIVDSRPDVPVVVVTAFGSFETAIAAIRAGAHDYITKPFQMEALSHTLRHAVQHRALREQVRRLQQEVLAARTFEAVIGESPAMKVALDMVARVADSEASVLITGESGTGKRLLARALHDASRRKDGPFVTINCAAVPEELLESELFGHTKSTFTHGFVDHPGLFVQASGGTVFLDQIGDMPLALQAKLLRALQERRLRPLGRLEEVPFDARLIVATNRDLEAEVAEHRFREDLYYRINVVQIQVPPLRVRGNDVLLLAQHFVRRFAPGAGKNVVGLSPAAAARLLEYPWPGNVRELSNAIERAIALTRYEEIAVEDLPERVQSHKKGPLLDLGAEPSEIVPLEEVERRYILRVLEAVSGNKSLAAQLLGLDRKTLYRKLERYGVAGKDGKERG
jgi:two-component system response regulator HydG